MLATLFIQFQEFTGNFFLASVYLTEFTPLNRLYTLFLICFSFELYSFLYNLKGKYTPFLYTLGSRFRQACATPISVSCTPHCIILLPFMRTAYTKIVMRHMYASYKHMRFAEYMHAQCVQLFISSMYASRT